MPMKPRVFIGCSSESSKIAVAVQQELGDRCDCVVWNQMAPSHGQSIIASLRDPLDHFDYAIFVYGQDDVAEVRGERVLVARDNVVLEHGMFIARLGPERARFLVADSGPGVRLRLPSDLNGILHGVYDASRARSEPRAAVAPFCAELLKTIDAREDEWVWFKRPCVIWECAAISDADAGNGGPPTITYCPCSRIRYTIADVEYRHNIRTAEVRLQYRLGMTMENGVSFEGATVASGVLKDGWAYMNYRWTDDATNRSIVGVCVVHVMVQKLVGYWMTADFLADRPGAVVFGAGASD